MLDKLKSRKLWISVLGTAFIALAKGLSIEISDEQIMSIAGIVMAYVAGQGYVDGQRGRTALGSANGGYSASRSVDPDKIIPPKGGSAVREAKAK